jgi:cobalt-zinc-cadmium efflux system membrane fusion protein
VSRLPDKYRIPLVLCYLEGKTTAEAARHVGCPRGTVLSRLARARERLRLRLAERGLAPLAALATLGLAESMARAVVPPTLAGPTVEAALAHAAGTATGDLISAQAVALAKGAMQAMLMTRLRIVAGVLLLAGMLGTGAGWLTQAARAGKPGEEPGVARVKGDANAVRLTGEAVTRLGIRTGEAKPRGAPRPRVLQLPGALALDPQRLSRVRLRCAGEVLEVKGKVGEAVKKGDVLAVAQSKDLAEKKSAYVDALVQWRLDQDVLERAEKGAAEGAVPEAFVLNARRTASASEGAANRARTTLLALQVPEEEIKALKAYAEGLAKPRAKRDPEKEKTWARVEVRAPRDGIIVERNVNAGDVIDPTSNLFTVADSGRLLVVVQAPEADLPALQALPAEQRRWVIRPAAEPRQAVEGKIDQIGYLIDPNQHTATLTGTVANPEGRLRPGQFITASVTLATPQAELVIPASALVEDGRESFVFVQPDPDKPIYVQRRVTVVRRGQDMAHVRFTLKPGERLVTAGALELKAGLDDLQAQGK